MAIRVHAPGDIPPSDGRTVAVSVTTPRDGHHDGGVGPSGSPAAWHSLTAWKRARGAAAGGERAPGTYREQGPATEYIQ